VDPRHARKIGQLVAGIIVTDDELHPAEESLHRRIAARLGLSTHGEGVVEPAPDAADAAALVADLPEEVRAEALELIIDAAIVDGKVVPAEQRYIEEVATAMGIDADTVEEHITNRLIES
jgi:uncharacterized tellurite resistance protein B-like protein